MMIIVNGGGIQTIYVIQIDSIDILGDVNITKS